MKDPVLNEEVGIAGEKLAYLYICLLQWLKVVEFSSLLISPTMTFPIFLIQTSI